MSYKTILIIAYEKNALNSMVSQLLDIGIRDYFNIEARIVEDIDHSSIENDTMVLLSSHIVYKMVKPFLNDDIPYIISKRMINFSKIRHILEIPKGERVLLVSNLKGTAKETIDIFQEIGVQLELEPYYPGASFSTDISTAITPGEVQLVPGSIKKTIDIGSRIIDISTIFEIFNRSNITSFSYNHLSARYMQSLLQITDELSDEILKSKVLQTSLESIINNIDDAVIVYSQHERIRAVNQRALNLLNLNHITVINRKMKEIVSSTLVNFIRKLEVDEDQFFEVNKEAFYVRKKDLRVENQPFGSLIIFREIDEIRKIEHEFRNKSKEKNLVAKYSFKDIKTESNSIHHIKNISKKLAKSDSTILLLGETGTGKEVFAQAIHNASTRSNYPFVGVNFAAISETLLESELFGYESGAFTGAKKNGHIGLFEQAHKGTIFLDEIGDASPSIQNRLLRVLQEKQIMRLGGDQVISLDVRIIAATNKDLNQLIQANEFREDLYYRLSVLPINIPPLRLRKNDILPLFHNFAEEFYSLLKRPPFKLSDSAKNALLTYDWPGNIRELRNVAEYVAHICEEVVYEKHLPFSLSQHHVLIDTEESDSLEELIQEFEQKEFLHELVLILHFLKTDGAPSSGRHAILNYLKENNVDLTDQQLRYRQKLLNEKELILIQRGRKGSKITCLGEKFLEKVKG
ncbi:sigma-54 interaction domain-containing protein [Pseudalkalibacillus caeni]|uniref:AAA family ATPase n=1 Tax=Exobacillus caeni TaxID=2574798 RepID=A0A5R9FAE6_9BACL|nr:sigma 54-interacting transcriptional regulator [Pseudalkalibacillus caeni]TLS38628.1 AAA family ATPase [Pseudalkalibacillus caeni]